MNYYENNDHHNGRNEDINNRILDLLDYAFTKRHRNLIIQMVVRFPDNDHYYDEDYMFKRFMATFSQNRNRKGYGCLYFWKRERSQGTYHGHYHLVLLMDAKVTLCIYGHTEYANELWNSYFDHNNYHVTGIDEPPISKQLIYCSRENNGQVISRNDLAFDTSIYDLADWLGYLAKNYTTHRFENKGHVYGLTKNIPQRDPFMNIFDSI
jgi:hypothetical protein